MEDVDEHTVKKILLKDLEIIRLKEEITKYKSNIIVLKKKSEEDLGSALKSRDELVKKLRNDIKNSEISEHLRNKTHDTQTRHKYFVLSAKIVLGYSSLLFMTTLFLASIFYNPQNTISMKVYNQLMSEKRDLEIDNNVCKHKKDSLFSMIDIHTNEPDWTDLSILQKQPVWMTNQGYDEYLSHYKFEKQMGINLAKKQYDEFVERLNRLK